MSSEMYEDKIDVDLMTPSSHGIVISVDDMQQLFYTLTGNISPAGLVINPGIPVTRGTLARDVLASMAESLGLL